MPDHSAPFTVPRCYSALGPKETGANETTTPLILQLGKLLSNEGELSESSGHSIVYEVEVLSQDGVQLVPPMVAKIAKESTGRKLSREAGFYERLRSLQGVIIPRCYGYFRRFINLQEVYIIPWDSNPDETVFPRTGFSVYNLPHPAASLNILLLERLGRPLDQISRLGKYRGSLRSQLSAMVSTVSEFDVFHMDIAGRNVLEASTTPLDPGTVDTSHGPYNWRIIDWECADTSPERDLNRSYMVHDVKHMLEYELPGIWDWEEVKGSKV
ncbi:hypothetical protein C8Q78DRAFT_1077522 [Trametes maxima]|nr:hypothetical protein C8Q78DRAFT_1077522 [Trametes maxima]